MYHTCTCTVRVKTYLFSQVSCPANKWQETSITIVSGDKFEIFNYMSRLRYERDETCVYNISRTKSVGNFKNLPLDRLTGRPVNLEQYSLEDNRNDGLFFNNFMIFQI